MKRLRISKLGSQLLSPASPSTTIRLSSRQTCCSFYASSSHRQIHTPLNRRSQSTSAIASASLDASQPIPSMPAWNQMIPLEKLPSPPPAHALKSAKLAALHSRLSLPSRLPMQTLARTLVDATADRSPDFNNRELAMLGKDLLGYYTAEHIMCHYPRLPVDVFMAAQWAYVGPKALSAIAREWGVDHAAEPGGEVDPGLLQLRIPAADANIRDPASKIPFPPRRGFNWRIVHDDQFGEMPLPEAFTKTGRESVTTLEEAHENFVRAVFGALYLHCGRVATYRFFQSHILSRHLDLSTLFDFHAPTRDLSRLCAREGFEPPVARLISETGRLSRHPVFVVGVFSGRDKLGEGAGSSLDEGRVRAAVNALKSWYLYSPQNVTVPSSVENNPQAQWNPNHVDPGEIVV